MVSILACFVISPGSLNAQWFRPNTGTTKNLLSANYFNANEIWIGGTNCLVKSTNGGLSWTVVDPIITVFNATIPSLIEDLEVLSPSSAIAAGFFYTGGFENILLTADSGAKWSIVYQNNPGTPPRTINAVDRIGTLCFAVGSNGTLLRSTDSGANWSIVPSGTTSAIYDVQFISPTLLFASGENVLVRSVDGGLNWTANSKPGHFNTLSATSNRIYMGDEFSDSIYVSSDNGQTFTSGHMPFPFSGEVFALSDDSLLAAGTDGLYISFNGGLGWEKYNFLVYRTIHGIDFLNSNAGVAVGDSGFVIQTNNIGLSPSYPLPMFSITAGSIYCQGDTISLVNSTYPYPGYQYSWKIDGVEISTQYNASYVLSSPGSVAVSLTVANQYGARSVSQPINVIGHDILPFLVHGVPDTTCAGNPALIAVPNSQSGVNYRLRNGFVNNGTSKAGNGDTLYFVSTNGITAPTDFNIIATRTNSCFVDSLIQPITIYPRAQALKWTCPPSGSNTYGIIDFSFNTIHNGSLPNAGAYTDYSCRMNTNLLAGNTYPLTISSDFAGYCTAWIDYDSSGTFDAGELILSGQLAGGVIQRTIMIPSTQRVFNFPLRLRILYNRNNALTIPCSASMDGESEDYAVIIHQAPSVPVASFTFTTSTACTTNVNFFNTSTNSDEFSWDFGDGDTTSLLNPTHQYTASGMYLVKLISRNQFGSDTLTQNLYIQNPSTPDSIGCSPTPNPLSCTRSMFYSVQVNNSSGQFHNFSLGSTFGYDLTCTQQIHLIADSTYTLVYQLRDIGTTNCGGTSCAWIDYNGDGSFNETDERLWPGNIGGCPTTWLGFTVPSTALKNVPLRIRISSDDNNVFGSCSQLCGQYVDFTVIIHAGAIIHPGFTASLTTTCVQNPITFTNSTTNATNYYWDFGDGSSSTAVSPTHTYNNPGLYSVRLTACNTNGDCDSLVKTAYLNIRPTEFVKNVDICAGQSYVVDTNIYSISGVYVDSLTTPGGCDSIIITNLSVHNTGPIIAAGTTSICVGDSVALLAPSWQSIQWYKGTLPIPSANTATYYASTRGRYWCFGIDPAQCAVPSNSIRVNIVCLPAPVYSVRLRSDDILDNEITIYPIPASERIHVHLSEDYFVPGLQWKLLDIQGRIVRSGMEHENEFMIPVSGLAQGFYNLEIDSGRRGMKRVVIY